MNNKFISFLASAVLISGCGSEGGSTVDEAVPSTVENNTPSTTELEGSWLKSCSAVDQEDPETLYDIVALEFTGSTFSSSIQNYTDSSCLTSFDYAPNPTSSGYFSLGSDVTTSGGLQATEIDTHIEIYNGAEFDIDEYTIYYIDGTALYVGDDSGINDASSAELRPNALNFERVFVKQ
ncbi:hypothetical protein [Reinekea marinisedimentorum]|uniref:Lipocalin-like protein n=1 Tax=Reinekea marinisedimentorum TaxID=230495 RepID=A0A4R3I474_9GAMM|nr:hypothetical protein [Reinekea marinisedimentorum]TCS38749.1 hypothetical protein BCF53_11523 [Reinekea marinisedimentorum]